jgi:hypothetical protein
MIVTPFLRHGAFLALLVVSSAYALTKGGRPEQVGSVTLLGGALLTVGIARPLGLRFHNLETGILLVDLMILGVFLWLSLRTTRFWPIWIAALLAAEVVMHLSLILAPGIVPEAYMDAVGIWSWGDQLIVVVATWRHRTRLTRTGADVPWKT